MENRTRSAPRHLTLTVGPDQGDLQGRDDKTLQAAADYLHRLGGGTLQILPGEYAMRNALYLHPGMTLRGSGEDTVLKKAPSTNTPLVRDADWYENQVEVADPSGFSVGGGIMLRAWVDDRMEVVKDTVVAIDGPVLSLSRRLEKNFWLQNDACAATLFPLLTAEHVDDVTVEDLTLDGNRAQSDEINGNYAGGVFIQHCDRFTFRRVTSRHYHGDGFSFQVCDDVHFEDCRALDNANLGFHPGSGSQRPRFIRCTARGNSQGIFFCWGVTDGEATDCDCSDNTAYGITIGHRDTDNRILRCTLQRNAKVGLLFRQPQSEFRGAHRNLIEACLIADNGPEEDGVGLEVSTQTHGVTVRGCRFADNGQGHQRIGIRLHPGSDDFCQQDNTFDGLEEDLENL